MIEASSSLAVHLAEQLGVRLLLPPVVRSVAGVRRAPRDHGAALATAARAGVVPVADAALRRSGAGATSA